ncbi:MAG TPA: hypothetical protein PLD27_00850 [bacterium]|nr:hypothetical protein [bacterium]HOL46898.1 hypothetical protein [bacterium]HPQ18340.1 hypothetical protein [bacterium]
MKIKLLTICLIIYISQINLLAHKVNLFTDISDKDIIVDAYFNDGKKCVNSKIEVYNNKDEKIAEGFTDQNGKFQFTPIKKEDLKIILNASLGHRTEYLINKEELTMFNEENNQKKIITNQSKKNINTDSSIVSKKNEMKLEIDYEIIRKIIEEELDKRIKPLEHNYKELLKKEEVSIKDIISGVGYIIGVFGIIAFIKSFKNK